MQCIVPDIPLQVNPEDYTQDGLLYCGKCHTPKQCVVNLFGVQRKMACLCVCGVEQRERDKLLAQENRRLQAIQALRDNAFSEKIMQGWKFENESTISCKVIEQAKRYCQNFESFYKKGRGLMFAGNVGTGKTYAACCIANFLIDKMKSVIIRNFADISNQLFVSYDKQEYMIQFSDCHLLIIDDFSMERNTPYMNETVYNVIDTRYRSGKPLIVTTNLNMSQIKNCTETEKKRVYSRLIEMCIPINVIGEDMRNKKAIELYRDDIDILNGVLK